MFKYKGLFSLVFLCGLVNGWGTKPNEEEQKEYERLNQMIFGNAERQMADQYLEPRRIEPYYPPHIRSSVGTLSSIPDMPGVYMFNSPFIVGFKKDFPVVYENLQQERVEETVLKDFDRRIEKPEDNSKKETNDKSHAPIKSFEEIMALPEAERIKELTRAMIYQQHYTRHVKVLESATTAWNRMLDADLSSDSVLEFKLEQYNANTRAVLADLILEEDLKRLDQ